MAPRDWRMLEMCDDCPFQKQGKGLALAKSLRPGRLRSIKAGLRRGELFHCHKTTTSEGDDDGGRYAGKGAKLCAGSLDYQDSIGVSSNYVRVCESLDYFEERRKP